MRAFVGRRLVYQSPFLATLATSDPRMARSMVATTLPGWPEFRPLPTENRARSGSGGERRTPAKHRIGPGSEGAVDPGCLARGALDLLPSSHSSPASTLPSPHTGIEPVEPVVGEVPELPDASVAEPPSVAVASVVTGVVVLVGEVVADDCPVEPLDPSPVSPVVVIPSSPHAPNPRAASESASESPRVFQCILNPTSTDDAISASPEWSSDLGMAIRVYRPAGSPSTHSRRACAAGQRTSTTPNAGAFVSPLSGEQPAMLPTERSGAGPHGAPDAPTPMNESGDPQSFS